MPGKHCKKRSHTPIKSQAERGLMGADYRRGKKGQKKRTGMSQPQLRRHLKESKGKKLPNRVKRKR